MQQEDPTMVFSSVPIYMDPSNWNHEQPANHQADKGNAEEAGMSASAAIRPGSMAERARLAKIPQPEPALKCPRCDSNNTKFCYFNNYSLTQPRHFCKTCLRYWTHGGALRNVPLGGGCRRNMRINKAGGSSKSHATTATCGKSGASSSSATSGGAIHSNMLHPSHLPFISPSFNFLADYGTAANLGLNFSGMQHFEHAVDQYQIGSSSGLDQWRIQQIQQLPFMGGMETPPPPPPPPVSAALSGLFPFDYSEINGGNDGGFTMQVLPNFAGTSGLISQLASVNMEDNQRGLSLPRQYLGVIPGNDQYWGGANNDGGGDGWSAGLSGFNASFSGNLL